MIKSENFVCLSGAVVWFLSEVNCKLDREKFASFCSRDHGAPEVKEGKTGAPNFGRY